MNIAITIVAAGLAVLAQDVTGPQDERKAQDEAPAVRPDRAQRLRELSARSSVAEKDLLFSTVPEERAKLFVEKERGRFGSEIATKREQMEFLEEELESYSKEHRLLVRSGEKERAEEYLAGNRREIIKLIREYSALTREVTHGDRQISQMNTAEKRLAALIDYKSAQRRKYERSNSAGGFTDPSGIDPNLIPEVMAAEEDDSLSPDAQRLFESLFGNVGWDVEAFTMEAAQAVRWRY